MEANLVKKSALDTIKIVDYISVDILKVCGISIGRILSDRIIIRIDK